MPTGRALRPSCVAQLLSVHPGATGLEGPGRLGP
jgi:hypothetical protein